MVVVVVAAVVEAAVALARPLVVGRLVAAQASVIVAVAWGPATVAALPVVLALAAARLAGSQALDQVAR